MLVLSCLIANPEGLSRNQGVRRHPVYCFQDIFAQLLVLKWPWVSFTIYDRLSNQTIGTSSHNLSTLLLLQLLLFLFV